MPTHRVHDEHGHTHGPACGHPAVRHDGHVDYVHLGHLHHPHDGHYDEHVVDVTRANPDACEPTSCPCTHQGCGHAEVQHGDHVDLLFDGRLHHRHVDHCDDHGPLPPA